MQNWKSFFYSKYVSSGQSNDINPYRHYTANFVNKYFPQDKNIKILDIGCGTGASLYTIKKMGYMNLYGIDISDEQIKIAQDFGLDFCQKNDILKNKELFANDFFDVILLIDVIEHFNKTEIIELLTLCNKILKNNGTLILHMPNAEGIFGSKIRYADFTHEISFTQKSITQILRMLSFNNNIKIIEDKPLTHSFISLIRLVFWEIFTFPFRFLHLIECGTFNVKLSQNILVIINK